MDELRRGLNSRLDDLAASRPDLVRALTLQRTLLSRQIDLLDTIRSGGVPGVSLPAGYLTAKLTRGIPALHGEPIPLPVKLLELSAREFCEHLAKGGAGYAASAVGDAMDTKKLDGAALLSACFGRDQRRVRFMAAQHGLSPDVAWLVAELALAPFVFLLQQRALPPGNGTVSSATTAWDRGFCPACGSWPAIIEVVGGAHLLRCSFCAATWQLSGYRCLYCANGDDTFVTAAPDMEQASRRVQMCGACGGYVKVLETGAPAAFPLIAVEDLSSMDLDMVAIERKYVRPPLPDIKKQF